MLNYVNVELVKEWSESFMLAANELLRLTIINYVPFVYRIHETPTQKKITTFFEALNSLGIEVTGRSNDVKPKMLQNILKKVAGKPEEAMVSTMLLRSMQQAKYSPDPLGHFGLAAKRLYSLYFPQLDVILT